MKLKIISFWYNEAFLAPFFLKHYEPVQDIRIILDADTDDNTRAILMADPRVSFIEHRFKEGRNTQIKQDILNREYQKAYDADWVLMVDADELLVFEDFRHLHKTYHDVFVAMLYQVYRNAKDSDLDPGSRVITQRRYGDPNMGDRFNALYRKPIIVRGGLPVWWSPGCRFIKTRDEIHTSPIMIRGAHWAMADPCFCIDRRLSRRYRISNYNKQNGMSWHNWGVTREGLQEQCDAHLNDPEVL